jgi:pentatricopeptide repeat protein
MSLSRRLGLPHRPFSSSSIASAFAQREYRGDPGPSSRKTEELRLRTSIRSGRKTLNDRNVLDGLLDASAPEAHRQRPFGQERPRIFPGRPSGGLRPRFDSTSKGFYKPRPLPQAQFEKLQPNPYDTSRQLREWIKAHPIPINFSKLQDAVGIVLGAEKGAVNAVVWNTLLGLVGRQGSLERMWKLYNDVSDHRSTRLEERGGTIEVSAEIAADEEERY